MVSGLAFIVSYQ
uniref:Uncharacterized protein n=1 Tax=Arundo donax TaxID=35708 RepID=A0A0A8YWP5_ARUDO